MKTFWLLVILFLSAAPSPAQILDGPMPAVTIDNLKFVLSSDRRKVFASGMHLREQDERAFWAVYDEFEKEKADLDEVRFKILGQYAMAAPLDRSEAHKLMAQIVSLQKKEISLREKYFKVMDKRVSTEAASRFVQIDDYIASALRIKFLGETLQWKPL